MQWNEHYETAQTPWDLGGPSPVVQRLAVQVLGAVQSPGTEPRRVIVPGCGFGHDAEAIARLGHQVVGADIAPAAMKAAAQRTDIVDWQVANAFAPPADWLGSFDAVVEHTLYCALEPEMLDTYRDAVHALLKPGGALFGAFLHHTRDVRPRGTNPDALRARFGAHFDIEMTPAENFGPMDVPQLAVVMRKR
ncbi:MAG: SAM-dependent methyltransferase [Bradymonadia bacterium]|jgi:SAM-dependent methyltransferase